MAKVVIEDCDNEDQQIQVTAGPVLYEGFYSLTNSWTQIEAVAGGFYEGQRAFRRGRFTRAIGEIGPRRNQNVPAGGDCGAGVLDGMDFFDQESTGQQMLGDSGGPFLLIYFGKYYLAGMAVATGVNGAQAFVEWRDVPNGWTACTRTSQCN